MNIYEYFISSVEMLKTCIPQIETVYVELIFYIDPSVSRRVKNLVKF